MKVEAAGPNSIFSKLGCLLSPKKQAKPPPLLVPSNEPTPSPNDVFAELQGLIDFFDEDGDGKLSPAELRNCMRIVGEELSPEDAEAVVESVDSDGDGQLCVDEFMELVKPSEECEGERRRHLMEAFRVYEMDGGGCITPESLRRALDRLGRSRSVEECEEMIRRFDINGDGVISFDEFEVMLM